MFTYSRYIAHVIRHPWMIEPEKFSVLRDLMRERLMGHRLSDEDIAARLASEPPAHLTPATPSLVWEGGTGLHTTVLTRDLQAAADSARGASRTIAVVPIHGTIAYRADTFEASSGGTSTELIGRWLARMTSDESVSGILLDFNTPGGSVEGTPELAAQIAKAATVKPVWAHVNALCASAGYYMAAQADEIVCTPSGAAGSIGVFMLTVDESEALKNAGVKINAISAGDYKLEGASWEPLSPDARAFLQGQVDTAYRDFLAAVAKGREITVAEVKKSYGQGRVFDAQEAKDRGMVDRIATFDDTLARMVGGGRSSRSGRAAIAPRADVQLGSKLDSTADDCPACKGTGLKPERYMSDPEGQEQCPTCHGTGKAAVAAADPVEQAERVEILDSLLAAMGRRS